jgi:signal transduction histidine kinase
MYCRHFVEEMNLNAGTHNMPTFTCQGTVRPINADEKLLRSILSNLLSNAIKYSPQGGNVDLTLEDQVDAALLKVQDWRIGIPLEDQKHLFEPFHRGKNVRTIPGTGLGLVVVKKCIDLHHGTIEFASEPNIGTTFWVTLPL